MTGVPALEVVAALVAIVLGVPLGLYALLTRRRRQIMREIRGSASREGWEFRRSFLRGDPTEFEIHGRTHSGVPWLLKCRGASGYVPTLGGQTDLAILTREHGARDARVLALQATPRVLAEIGRFSGSAAAAVDLLKDATELPSGLPAFDRAYQVLAMTDRFQIPLVDAGLAKRMLDWPADATKPHSVLAWRDPFGLHFEARLPGPPNWATVDYFRTLSEALIARVPPGTKSPEIQGIVDQFAEKFLRK